jgi:NADH-quinone oxidoreductase subunit C
MISNQEIENNLKQHFGASILSVAEPFGMLTIDITAEAVLPIMEHLFNHPEYRVQFMTDLCAVHYPDNTGSELAVVYHLHSLENNFRLRLKAYTSAQLSVMPSVTPLYKTANWMERETYDFYGIVFSGHPNLKRILNIDEMDYFPLRKEYTLEDPTRRDKVDKMFGR